MQKSTLQTATKFFRNYAHVVVALLVLVGVLWYFGARDTTAAWYSSGGIWDLRQKITINADNVDGNLTDFPVYVDLSDLPGKFHENVRDDGGDIRVTTADGQTEIPREVVSYNATSSSGELHFKAPSISSSNNTEFYIYYGNEIASDYAANATYGAENVWTNGQEAVWHLSDHHVRLKELPAQTIGYENPAGGFYDGNYGIEFKVTSDISLNTATLNASTSGSTTFELYKFDPETQNPEAGTLVDSVDLNLSAGENNVNLDLQTDGPGNYWVGRTGNIPLMRDNSSDNLFPILSDPLGVEIVGGRQGNGSGSNNFWYFLFDLEIEGSVDSSRVDVRNIPDQQIGLTPSGTYYNGDYGLEFNALGETTLKTATIDAENPGSTTFELYKFDPKSENPNDGRLVDSVELTGLSAGQNNVTLNLTTDGPGRYWVGRPDGFSLQRTADGQAFPFVSSPDGVRFLNGRNFTSSATASRWYYLFNLQIESEAPEINLEHFAGKDSTRNHNNASLAGGLGDSTLTQGRVGNALNFDGTSDYIDTNLRPQDVDAGGQVSYFTWINADQLRRQKILSGYSAGSSLNRWDFEFNFNNSESIDFNEWRNSNYISGNTSLLTNQWYHAGFVWESGQTVKVYLDGKLAAEGNIDNTSLDDGCNFQIGWRCNNSEDPWDGLMDSSRLYSSLLSADWIAAEYTNQNDTTSFYAVGEFEDNPGTFGNSPASDWADTDWANRQKLTIDHTQVDGDLTDFSVYVDLSDLSSQFFSNVNSDGGDIRVTDSGGTELAREIVSVDTGSNTGELYFKAPDLSASSDTTFYIYYGNSSASDYVPTDTHGRNAVWTQWDMVFHLNEDPTGSAPQFQDSTGARTATAVGTWTSAEQVEGKLGNALYFTDAYSDNELVLSDPVTFQDQSQIFFWLKNISAPGNIGIMHSNSLASPSAYIALTSGLDRMDYIDDGGVQENKAVSVITQDVWTHYAGLQPTGGDPHQYKDGALETSSSAHAGTGVHTFSNIGWDIYDGGALSFIGISSIPLDDNPDLVAAYYTNQNSPSTFYTVGTEQAFLANFGSSPSGNWGDTNWENRQKITINASEVDTTLTDFPVYVDISGMGIANEGSIRVTKGDGLTELPREVVSANELHFKADTISSTENTDFYIYYGNSAASDYPVDETNGRNAVWSDYESVLHFSEAGGSGVQGEFSDSTGKGRDATLTTGTSISTTGTYDHLGSNWLDFTGSEALTIENSAQSLNNSDLTLQAWVDLDSANSSTGLVGNRYASPDFEWAQMQTGGRSFVKNDSTEELINGTDATGIHKMDFVYDIDNEIRFYRNGSSEASDTSLDWSDGIQSGASEDYRVGTYYENISSRRMDGRVGEIRLRGDALSSNWISAEHTNQNTPTAFYTLSTAEAESDPPSLTNPTGFATGEYTADGSVTTNKATGEMYAVLTTSASKPTRREVKNGENHEGDAAVYAASQVVTSSGAKEFSATNLDPATTYWWHFMHEDGQGGDSSVATSESFITASLNDSNPWYGSTATSSGWDYRQKITIDSAKVDSDMTDFPVYVDLSHLPAKFHENVAADGGDIRVTTADGQTEIPREVVSYATSTDSGELHFKAPFLSGTRDTSFYIYYGNAGVSDYATNATYGAENVWSNYEAVLHDGASTDSSSNNNSGTAVNGLEFGTVDGQIGTATEFSNSANAYAELPGQMIPATSNFVISLWGRVNSGSDASVTSQMYYSQYTPSVSSGRTMFNSLSNGDQASQSSRFWSANTGTLVAGDDQRGNLIKLELKREGDTFRLYENGVLKEETTLGGADFGTVSKYVIGSFNDVGFELTLDGIMDEFRAMHGFYDENWTAAEYNNQNDPVSFYSLGTEKSNPSIFGQEANSGWGDDRWAYREKITIQSSEVGSDLTDFPVYVNLADLGNDFFNNVRADGGDIRVTAGDGKTELAREVVSINTGSNSGELHFKADSISSSADTEFYIYYGNNEAVDYSVTGTYGRNAVWSDYENVYHLSEQGAGVEGEYIDSAGNHDLTGGFFTSGIPQRVESNIGYGQEFNGTDTSIGGIFNLAAKSELVVSAWIKPTANGQSSRSGIYGYNTVGANEAYRLGGLRQTDTNLIGLDVYPDGNADWFNSSLTANLDEWSYLVGRYESGVTRDLLLNTQWDVQSAVTGTTASGSSTIAFGEISEGPDNRRFEGVISEARYSTLKRSQDFYAAEYSNQNSPSVFYAVDSQEDNPYVFGIESTEDWGDTRWSHREKITIKSSQIDGDLTDFPVYVDLANLSDNFHENVRSDAGDIRITTTDGKTEIPREVVDYSAGSNDGELHFKAPHLSRSVDTDFYIYYGNDLAEDYATNATYGAENVWTNGYTLVSHDGGATDSTSASNDGTVRNGVSPGGISGKLGTGTQFDGTDDYIALPLSYNSTDIGSFSVGSWVNIPATGGDWSIVDFDRSEYFTAAAGIPNGSFNGTGDYVGFHTNGSGGISDMYSTGTVRDGNWHYVVWDFDGSTKRIYIDGVEDSSQTVSTVGSSITRYGFVGDGSEASSFDGSRNDFYYEGSTDDIRLSSVARSADWISVEYTNQNTPLVFYAVGANEEGPIPTVNLSTPYSESTGVSRVPTLSWNSIGSAFDYDLQVSTSSDFSSLTVDETATTSSLTLGPPHPVLAGDETYYWRVRGKNNDSTGEWSSVYSFSTQSGIVGTGTTTDPYLIATPQDLNDVRNDLSGYYELTRDIDLTYDTQNSNGDFYNAGAGWDPIDGFDGVLDLAGHSIIGLYVDDIDAAGLFDQIGVNAIIENGKFTNADINGGNDQGVIVGNVGGGLIRQVVVENSSVASGDTTSSRIGGFSGRGVDTRDVISRNNVLGGGGDKGGNTGRVFDAKEFTRNLVHNVNWENPNSTTDNPVFGWIHSGGSVTVNNTFYDDDTLNYTGSRTDQGTSLTTAQAKDFSTYSSAGWDIVLKENHDGKESTATWYIDDGNDYPRLWFERDYSMEGSGTAADPYQVSTPQDLHFVRNDLDAHYELTNDIDLTFDTQDPSGDFYNGGAGWNPIGDWASDEDFTGVFDFKGFSVIGMKIDRSGGSIVGQGLFASTGGGAHIHSGAVLEFDVTGDFSQSGLIGRMRTNNTTVVEYMVGEGSVSGTDDSGMLVGWQQAGTLRDSRGSGSTNNNDWTGGITGDNSGTFNRLYFVGNTFASSGTNWGGVTASATSSDTFYDKDVAGEIYPHDPSRARTTAEMYNIQTYLDEGWDIVPIEEHDGKKNTATWYIDDGNDYPRLWHEYGTEVDNGMEGAGTAANPYQVATPQNLHDVRMDLDAYYELANDIDLTYDTQDPSGDFYNGGAGWDPIDDFSGSLDLKGFSVIGLTINRPSTIYQGLIGTTNNGFYIANGQIVDYDITARDWSGALVGKSENIGSGANLIENISVSGFIDGASNDNIGSVVGWADTSSFTIRNVKAQGNVIGGDWSAGVIGEASSGSVLNNLMFVGAVTSSFSIGGISWSDIATDSYYDQDVAGEIYGRDPSNATTTAVMQDINTYTAAGWDILPIEQHDGQESTATWYIDDGNDYPRLWFEFGEEFGTESSAGWGDDRWDYREKITIDADAIDEDLTDFPVYVDLSDLSGDFHENVRTDGGDIRITKADKTTQLPREVVSYNAASSTGELHFKADSISSTEDTSFYIYYGNAEATDLSESSAYGAYNVWTNGYELVSHDGGATDSTINGNDSTAGGGVTVGGATGQLGDATAFDGTDDHLSLSSRHTAGESEVTLSLWLNPVSCGSSQAIYDEAWDDDPNNPKYWQFSAYCGAWYTRDTSTGRTGGRNNDLSMPAISGGAWQHLTFAYSTAGGYKRVYLDGNQAAETTNSVDQLTSDDAGYNYIARPNDGSYFEGDIDELRLATVQRSTGWLAAEHANQAGTGSFYTTGATNVTAESWNLNDWPHREKITIQASQVAGNVTDFPVYVDLSDLSADFHNLVKDNGGDIRVTNASGTELAREIVSIDTSTQTGELHFKADSLSATEDTIFYIYYGNAGAIDYPVGGTYGAENVWTNGQQATWHLNEDPSGSAPQIVDSTVNNNDGTTNGGMTGNDLVSGQMGSALDFDGIDDYVNLGGASALNMSNGSGTDYPMTITGWVNISSSESVHLLSKTGPTTSDWEYYFRVDGSNLRFRFYDYGYTGGNDDRISKTYNNFSQFDSWAQVTVTYDGSKTLNGIQLYVNGQPVTETASEANNYSGGRANTADLSMGVFGLGGAYEQFTSGKTDDVRVYNTAHSAIRISTEYNNQNSPSTFYTTSSQSQESTTAPTPDPMTFEVAPENASAGSVTMTATGASGSGPFAYKFFAAACSTNGGTGMTDSGWQSSRTYTDTGLDANQCYTYSVKVRDSQGNETATSTALSTYTAAAVPGLPTLSSASDTTLNLGNSTGSNPLSAPTTTFAVRITETAPNDGTWDGQYVAADGTQSGTPVWLTDSELDAITVQNLQPGTSYTAQAMARNEDGDETALSTPATTATTGGSGGGSGGTSTQLRGGSTIRGGTNIR